MSVTIDKERPIILYGDRLETEKFLYQNSALIGRISFCIFDDCDETICHGIPVCKYPRTDRIADRFVLVTAAEEEHYFDIKKRLESIGKEEFKDFIWSRAYNKKIVVVNANCHGEAIISYLALSKKFRKEYFVYPLPQIQENYEGRISQELLLNTDIYMHQDIRRGNSVSDNLSDEAIEKCLSKGTLNITIPNLVGMGNWMFPSLKDLDRIIKTQKEVVYILYRDEILDEAERNMNGTVSEFVEYWSHFNYDDTTLDELWNMNKAKLKGREKSWDIKVSDFIYNNYKSIPCFADANHPSKYVMKEIGRQVAQILELTDICDEGYESNMGLPIPILPSVRDHFGLNFTVSRERKRDYFGKEVEDSDKEIEDYIHAYLWWYHDRVI